AGGQDTSTAPAGPPAAANDTGREASALSQELGLAVIAGLADDVEVARTAEGLSIRMSWPSATAAG
ncbi:MAG: ATP-binding protein, partial [Actinobacteria bacterium]|nr:ATP-binding protein [Actinomycetota bacterium]